MSFSTTKKIVSIVSIVFKTFATRMAGGSGDEHYLLSCVVLKTIETIETILKKQYFFVSTLSCGVVLPRQPKPWGKTALAFQNNVVFPKNSFVFPKQRCLSQNQRCLLRQLEHALDRLDGIACNVGRHIDGGPLVEKRVIHLLKGVHLHKLTLVA